MRKYYKVPEIYEVSVGTLCTDFETASVYKGEIKGDKLIDNITVREQDETKDSNIFKDKTFWGND